MKSKVICTHKRRPDRVVLYILTSWRLILRVSGKRMRFGEDRVEAYIRGDRESAENRGDDVVAG